MQVNFNQTTFHKGMNAAFGKIPVALEIHLEILDAAIPDGGAIVKMELSVGSDRMYGVNDISRFLESCQNRQPCHFSKNFIFEPEKMYFEKAERRLLEYLCGVKMRREYRHAGGQELRMNEIIFDEIEGEGLLNLLFADIHNVMFRKQPEPLHFEEDIHLNIKVEKNGRSALMKVDYSAYGHFQPLSIDFTYLYFKRKRLIVKLPEEKRELIRNLYPFQNDEELVCFKIDANEMRLFQRNFLDPYGDKLGISVDKKISEEMKANRLLTKVYIDVAAQGIVSKMEFCYEDKIYNPLHDSGADKSFREIDKEKKALDSLCALGFREYGRLFLLADVEKIMFLLTDKLTELKKLAEVYYSVDFKKLHVKNLDSIDFSLSEDDGLIHMNINLENVTDEELIELLDAIKKGKKYYRLRNGSIINLATIESSRLASLINSLDLQPGDVNSGLFEIPLSRCMYIDQYLKENHVENVKIDDRLGYLMKKVSNPVEMEVNLPGNLKAVLRNYQVTGVKWLRTMASYSFGGILADDMGLGKTLQVLAFIAAGKEEAEKNNRETCMVVAPTSVVYNWKYEAEKYTPELKVAVITGVKEKRSLLISGYQEFDLIITSYGALKNDIADYQNKEFLYIFLDEAQNIKNPETLNANSVKNLTARCAFALTGTPIENRLTELWSIFDFIMPGLLPERTRFMREYEEPIMRHKNAEKMTEFSAIIKPFILRRMKKDVLSELPDKIETNYLTEMTDRQKKLYAAFYRDFKRELVPKIEEFGLAKNHIQVLSALTRLRQICAHPGTFLDEYSGGSGKLDLAMDLIDQCISSGHSILLFSQFTKMLQIIRGELIRNDINYYYLDGKMKPEERMIEVDNFNHDKESVFLVSLKAGGTGLNLTKADVVIHFDPWWNPAVENQASDRAHRLGQKNVVQVYNLLTEGTIEEMVARLKERKTDLLEGLITPGEGLLQGVGEDEIRELFSAPGHEEAVIS